MNIKVDIIKSYIADSILNELHDFEIDANKITDTIATIALGEIQNCLSDDELSDFEVVEKIVAIFEKYDIKYGNRHDY